MPIRALLTMTALAAVTLFVAHMSAGARAAPQVDRQTTLLTDMAVPEYPDNTYLPTAYRTRSHVFIEGEPFRLILRLWNGDVFERDIAFAAGELSSVFAWRITRDEQPMASPFRVRPETYYNDRQQRQPIEWKSRLRLAGAGGGWLEWFTESAILPPGEYILRVQIRAADEQGRPAIETGISVVVLSRTPELDAELARRVVSRAFLGERYEEARVAAARFLEAYPDSVAGYKLLGLIAQLEGESEFGSARTAKLVEAQSHYQRAIALLRSGADTVFRRTHTPEEQDEYLKGLGQRLMRCCIGLPTGNP